MAFWLPAAKLILPHLADIVSVAAPAFTRRRNEDGRPESLQHQIMELQSAVTQNATHIKELAQQLQLTIQGLEDAAVKAQAKVHRAWLIALIGFGCGLLALILSLLGLIAG